MGLIQGHRPRRLAVPHGTACAPLSPPPERLARHVAVTVPSGILGTLATTAVAGPLRPWRRVRLAGAGAGGVARRPPPPPLLGLRLWGALFARGWPHPAVPLALPGRRPPPRYAPRWLLLPQVQPPTNLGRPRALWCPACPLPLSAPVGVLRPATQLRWLRTKAEPAPVLWGGAPVLPPPRCGWPPLGGAAPLAALGRDPLRLVWLLGRLPVSMR